jgi:SH3 domain protein
MELEASTVYVDDKLYLGFYRSQEGSGKQFATAPSGTKLTLIEVGNAYSMVRTESGTEGWVKKKYLVETPPAIVRIKSLQQQAERTGELVDKLRKENANLREEINYAEMQWQKEVDERAAIRDSIQALEPPAAGTDAVNPQQVVAFRVAINDAIQVLQKATITKNATAKAELSFTAWLFGNPDDETLFPTGWVLLVHGTLLIMVTIIGFFLGIFILDRHIRRQQGGYRTW